MQLRGMEGYGMFGTGGEEGFDDCYNIDSIY